jgi:hypothetical protein
MILVRGMRRSEKAERAERIRALGTLPEEERRVR